MSLGMALLICGFAGEEQAFFAGKAEGRVFTTEGTEKKDEFTEKDEKTLSSPCDSSSSAFSVVKNFLRSESCISLTNRACSFKAAHRSR
jgi:hypothetical protein